MTGACFGDDLKVTAFAVFGVLQHLGLAAAWVAVSIWPPGDSVMGFCSYWLLCGATAILAVLGAQRALNSMMVSGGGSASEAPLMMAVGASLCDQTLFPAEHKALEARRRTSLTRNPL